MSSGSTDTPENTEFVVEVLITQKSAEQKWEQVHYRRMLSASDNLSDAWERAERVKIPDKLVITKK